MDKNQGNIQASFDLLGLDPDASIGDLKRSFNELCALYDKSSLATYSLLDDEGRRKKIKSLYDAYERIMHFRENNAAEVNDLETEKESFHPSPGPINIDADINQMPGLYLEQSRKARGLTLQDMAERTKFRAPLLECIENQELDELPEPFYLKSLLRQIAQISEVPDVDLLVDRYMALYNRYRLLRGG